MEPYFPMMEWDLHFVSQTKNSERGLQKTSPDPRRRSEKSGPRKARSRGSTRRSLKSQARGGNKIRRRSFDSEIIKFDDPSCGISSYSASYYQRAKAEFHAFTGSPQMY